MTGSAQIIFCVHRRHVKKNIATATRGVCGVTNRNPHTKEGFPMLWTIVVILLVLWLLGLLGNIGGGLIHLLLVIALIVIVVNLLQRRR